MSVWIVVNSNKKHTNNPLTSLWGKTNKATNNNNGYPINNNQQTKTRKQ
jgi:hypothetical protein